MTRRIRFTACVAIVAFGLSGDLLACGDKFLMAGRGTRYQRPKSARAASILIYANPASGLPADFPQAKIESVLKNEGHRATTVATYEQLSAILTSGRFDVVLASSGAADTVKRLVGATPEAAVVVALDQTARDRSLLKAVDKAVSQRDQNAKKQARTS